MKGALKQLTLALVRVTMMVEGSSSKIVLAFWSIMTVIDRK